MIDESDTKLKLIKENMKSVLKNNSKFYAFLFLGGNQKKLLAEGNTLKSVEKDAVKKMLELVNNDINKLKKLDGKNVLYMFHLRKPNKKEIDDDKIKGVNRIGIGGRIGLFVSYYVLTINEDSKNPIIIENYDKDRYGLTSKYWLNDRYLKKFNIIDIKHIKKILDVINSGSPFAVRKLTDVIKKELPLYLTT